MKNMDETPLLMILQELAHLGRYEAARRLERFGLKPSQAGILFVLNSQGSMSQRKLAEEIGITPPSMTVALRKLENQGLIQKEPDACDQRVVKIKLSESGKVCIEKMKGMMDEMEYIFCRGLSQEEKLLLRRLFQEMKKNIMDSKEFRGMDMCSIMKKTRPPLKPEI